MPNYVLSDGVFVPFAYTAAEIDDMFSVIPISRYGDKTTDPLPVTVAGTRVTIGETPLIMGGKKYILDSTIIQAVTTPNSLRWLFVTMVDGVPGYVMSETYVVNESTDTMYVGTIATSASGVVTADLKKVTRLDIYRLSATRVGSAIPISTGDPTGAGNFAW